MINSVFCAIRDQEHALIIVDMLRTAGFFQSEFSLLFPNDTVENGFPFMVREDVFGSTKGFPFMVREDVFGSTAAPTNKTEALANALGWLEDLGEVVVPRLGPFIAAGPIRAKLSGSVGRWSVRGITEALIEMGVAEASARNCERTIRAGSILISIHSANDDEIARAERLFEVAGAFDIWLTEECGVQCRLAEPVC